MLIQSHVLVRIENNQRKPIDHAGLSEFLLILVISFVALQLIEYFCLSVSGEFLFVTSTYNTNPINSLEFEV